MESEMRFNLVKNISSGPIVVTEESLLHRKKKKTFDEQTTSNFCMNKGILNYLQSLFQKEKLIVNNKK